MLLPILFLIVGLVILIFGGELFVKGAASMARKLNVSTIVIGLTVVAFGTSAPELIVNIFSAVQGASDIAIGNVLGSNISNILLVLGIAGLITPLTVKEGTAWKEIPFGILAVIVLFFLVNDKTLGTGGENVLTRADGLILISFFVIFLYYTYGLSKAEGERENIQTYSWSRSLLLLLVGISALTLGGKLLVDNGVILARLAGLSELLIGLTITAIGTSMPELATSAIAAYRGHVDLAVGNVVGSNLFNILWVLGLTPIISPMTIGPEVNTDILVAAGAAIVLFFAMFNGGRKHGHRLDRGEAVMFLLLYIGYIGFVVVRG
jgi:cation:H+ antiporter